MDQLGFLERDPAGFDFGQNQYGYLGWSPPNLIDPSGEAEESGSILSWLRERNRQWNVGYPAEIPEMGESGVLQFLEETLGAARVANPIIRAFENWVLLRYGVSSLKRKAVGFSREITLAWPLVGVHFGDNFQIFEKGNGRFAAGIFAFETWHNARGDQVLPEQSLWGALQGPTGVSGLMADISVNANYAINIRRNVDNLKLSTAELVDSWAGPYDNYGFSTPIKIGGSYFASGRWAGISLDLGEGIGAAWSHPNSRLLVGPLVVSSRQELAALGTIYGMFLHFSPNIRSFLNPEDSRDLLW